MPYTARVARINGAVAASLALAPAEPAVMSLPRTGGANAPARRRRRARRGPARRRDRAARPMISRGSGYDARSAGARWARTPT